MQPLISIDELDRDLVDLLIDKIIVHGEKDIEIVWCGVFDEGGVKCE